MTSWDSDDELLGGGGVSAFPNREEGDVDEDALLGIDTDEQVALNQLEEDLDDLGDDEIIEVEIEEVEEFEPDSGYTEGDDTVSQEVVHHDDHALPEEEHGEEQYNDGDVYEDDNDVKHDTYNDDEDEEEEEEERGRFKSERTLSTTVVSGATKQHIPDTLELSKEDEEKLNEFEKAPRGKRGRGRGASARQRGGMNRTAQAAAGPHYRQGRAGLGQALSQRLGRVVPNLFAQRPGSLLQNNNKVVPSLVPQMPVLNVLQPQRPQPQSLLGQAPMQGQFQGQGQGHPGQFGDVDYRPEELFPSDAPSQPRHKILVNPHFKGGVVTPPAAPLRAKPLEEAFGFPVTSVNPPQPQQQQPQFQQQQYYNQQQQQQQFSSQDNFRMVQHNDTDFRQGFRQENMEYNQNYGGNPQPIPSQIQQPQQFIQQENMMQCNPPFGQQSQPPPTFEPGQPIQTVVNKKRPFLQAFQHTRLQHQGQLGQRPATRATVAAATAGQFRPQHTGQLRPQQQLQQQQFRTQQPRGPRPQAGPVRPAQGQFRTPFQGQANAQQQFGNIGPNPVRPMHSAVRPGQVVLRPGQPGARPPLLGAPARPSSAPLGLNTRAGRGGFVRGGSQTNPRPLLKKSVKQRLGQPQPVATAAAAAKSLPQVAKSAEELELERKKLERAKRFASSAPALKAGVKRLSSGALDQNSPPKLAKSSESFTITRTVRNTTAQKEASIAQAVELGGSGDKLDEGEYQKQLEKQRQLREEIKRRKEQNRLQRAESLKAQASAEAGDVGGAGDAQPSNLLQQTVAVATQQQPTVTSVQPAAAQPKKVKKTIKMTAGQAKYFIGQNLGRGRGQALVRGGRGARRGSRGRGVFAVPGPPLPAQASTEPTMQVVKPEPGQGISAQQRTAVKQPQSSRVVVQPSVVVKQEKATPQATPSTPSTPNNRQVLLRGQAGTPARTVVKAESKPSPTPNRVVVKSRTQATQVSITGLAKSTNTNHVHRIARECGTVTQFSMAMGSGHALVTFQKPEQAKIFVQKWDRKIVDLSRIRVMISTT